MQYCLFSPFDDRIESLIEEMPYYLEELQKVEHFDDEYRCSGVNQSVNLVFHEIAGLNKRDAVLEAKTPHKYIVFFERNAATSNWEKWESCSWTCHVLLFDLFEGDQSHNLSLKSFTDSLENLFSKYCPQYRKGMFFDSSGRFIFSNYFSHRDLRQQIHKTEKLMKKEDTEFLLSLTKNSSRPRATVELRLLPLLITSGFSQSDCNVILNNGLSQPTPGLQPMSYDGTQYYRHLRRPEETLSLLDEMFSDDLELRYLFLRDLYFYSERDQSDFPKKNLLFLVGDFLHKYEQNHKQETLMSKYIYDLTHAAFLLKEDGAIISLLTSIKNALKVLYPEELDISVNYTLGVQSKIKCCSVRDMAVVSYALPVLLEQFFSYDLGDGALINLLQLPIMAKNRTECFGFLDECFSDSMIQKAPFPLPIKIILQKWKNECEELKNSEIQAPKIKGFLKPISGDFESSLYQPRKDFWRLIFDCFTSYYTNVEGFEYERALEGERSLISNAMYSDQECGYSDNLLTLLIKVCKSYLMITDFFQGFIDELIKDNPCVKWSKDRPRELSSDVICKSCLLNMNENIEDFFYYSVYLPIQEAMRIYTTDYNKLFETTALLSGVGTTGKQTLKWFAELVYHNIDFFKSYAQGATKLDFGFKKREYAKLSDNIISACLNIISVGREAIKSLLG